MRRIIFACCLTTLCLASCAKYQLPPFSTSGDWTLQGNTVVNGDMQVNFGVNEVIANAGNGSYDLNFITNQAQFNAYDPKYANYFTDVIRQIPLHIDSIDVILADQFMIVTPNVFSTWEPDYVRRSDGAILTVQAIPVETLVQPHDELWRNLIFNNKKQQMIVVDRLIKQGKHYAIVYVLQTDNKSTPFSRNIQYDITSPRNVQTVGELLQSLFNISINALVQ